MTEKMRDGEVEARGEPPAKRSASLTLVAMAIPVFLLWLMGAMFVVLVADFAALLFVGRDGPVLELTVGLTIGWTLAASLVFLPGVESALGGALFKLKTRPAGQERDRLATLWSRVCATAGVDPSRYVLRIQETREVNASAFGYRLVGVTRGALALGDAELEGVLAHELGHHLALHPILTLLSWWYFIPGRVVQFALRITAWALGKLASIVAAVRVFARTESWGLVSELLLLVAVPIWLFVKFCQLTLGIYCWVCLALLAVMMRRAECEADRRAVEIGYGPGLKAALETFERTGAEGASRGLATRLFATHPALCGRGSTGST